MVLVLSAARVIMMLGSTSDPPPCMLVTANEMAETVESTVVVASPFMTSASASGMVVVVMVVVASPLMTSASVIAMVETVGTSAVGVVASLAMLPVVFFLTAPTEGRCRPTAASFACATPPSLPSTSSSSPSPRMPLAVALDRFLSIDRNFPQSLLQRYDKPTQDVQHQTGRR